MQESHDIYRKDPFPSQSRKKRRQGGSREGGSSAGSRSSGSSVATSGTSSGTTPGAQPPPARAHDLYHDRPQHRKHRSHQSEKNLFTGGLLLVALIAVLIAIYGCVLLISFVRKTKAANSRPAAEKTSVASAKIDLSSTNAMDTAIEAAALEEKIKAWNKAYDAVQEARFLLHEGHLDESEKRLKEVLAQAPEMIDLRVELAKNYVKQERYDEAKKILLEVLSIDPAIASARMALAFVYASQTNHACALAAAKWVLDTEPDNINANQIAAMSYLNLEKPGMAIPYLRRIVSMDKEDVISQNNLAVALVRNGEYEKATRIFADMLQRNAANSVTYFNLAICYSRQSMVDDAEVTLRRAAKNFGNSFVGAWLANSDFDGIRQTTQFSQLYKELTATNGTTVTSGPAMVSLQLMQPLDAEIESGIAPPSP